MMPARRPLPALVTLAALGLLPAAGPGQDDTLRLQGLNPAGARTTLTDSWGTVQFSIANPTDQDRDARVLVHFPDRPGVQYGRDVRVPARSVLTDWLPVGPPPGPVTRENIEIQSLLYDRTGGSERLLLPPGEGERVRSRLIRYRPRGPSTTLIVDAPPIPGAAGPPARSPGQAAALVKTVRAAANLSDEFATRPAPDLLPTPEAFDGTDHVVLAGNQLAAHPAALRALRQWVERGGRLWVMLDLVDPDTVAPLLGDEFPLHVVDRTSLTTVRLHRVGTPPPAGVEFEQPVELVRVLTTDGDRVAVIVNGWPAAFARTLGRGRILFTTLAAPGWLPPPGAKPAPPPPAAKKGPPGMPGGRPSTPAEVPSIQELAGELHPRGQVQPLPPDELRPLLLDEVGYAIPGLGTAAVVLGAFLLALLGLALGLRRARRPERIGWLAPAAAIAATAAFVVLAEASRRAVPPTVASAAIAEAVPGTSEMTVTGLLAVYQPESGDARLAAPHGGLLKLESEELAGQPRRRIQTDVDAWHLEGLTLPAGVRTGQFRYTARPGPVKAVAQFGPDGLDGRLTAPGFGPLDDALVTTPARQPIAVRVLPESRFAAGPADALAPGQYIAGTVLTDRQQRRQAVYRQMLGGPLPPHLDGRDLLMAWSSPGEVPVAAPDGTRVAGNTLVVMPLEFERPAPGTSVTIPAAFVAVRRADAVGGRPTLESTYPAEMRLRFQIPPSVLPLDVSRATFHLRVRAPARRVAVGGLADGRAVPLFDAEGPAEPVQVEIADPALLKPDADGGLYVTLAITNADSTTPEGPWRIESLGLEVAGQTAGPK